MYFVEIRYHDVSIILNENEITKKAPGGASFKFVLSGFDQMS